ncbi:acetyltransferase [Alteromonas macleodii]|uniref:Acetyltransferase EpsM n=1 Tax=Alteromonas macleodii TaxID=28108 RepID=A0A6T9XY61_ALTMA|nr:acetyltransferase [Alteromonas macleodii]CAB9493036.1 Acetyltransferase EpsM [Alteromonas macleodii]
MLKKVVIIGGGGNGLVVAQIVLDLIKAGEPVELVGFLNDNIPVGEYIERWSVLGAPHEWESLDGDVSFVYALLSVGKMKVRADKFKQLNIPQNRLATLVHPSASISFNVQLGSGVVVAANAVLQPGAKIGDNCFIRANANLGHDVTLDNLVDIGPNSTLCGYAHVEEGVQIAPNSVVRDSVRIGTYSTVAAGAAIFKDVAPGATMLGNPAKRIR